jgi:hypothetical protein
MLSKKFLNNNQFKNDNWSFSLLKWICYQFGKIWKYTSNDGEISFNSQTYSSSFFFFFFWCDWGLNWALHVQSGTLPLEQYLLFILLWLFLKMGSYKLSGLASNHDPFKLWLSRTRIIGIESLVLAIVKFFQKERVRNNIDGVLHSGWYFM